MTTSADLGISYIAGQQAQPEITHNTALNQLQILQTGVISVALNTPPGSPTQGDAYVLGTAPTGVWAGRANCIAGYFGTGWVFLPGVDSTGAPIAMGTRHEGLKVWNKADHKLYVWSGSAWSVPSSTGMTNPMTTNQDLIVGGAAGAPGRLGVGTNGFVLSVIAGSVAWAAATGFANPMTTLGDIILGGASGAPGRLAIGTTGQVLTVVSGSPAWATPASAGMTNPMTTTGDVIYGGAAGVPTRLAAGTNGYVLTLASGIPAWVANSAMANPMTTAGDLILGGSSGVAGRLGIGTTGQVLTVVGGTAAWATAAAGMTNPMTTTGDSIVGGSSGTPARLGIGTTGQVMTVVSGSPAWATPSPALFPMVYYYSASYTLTLADANSWLGFTIGSATTVTIPPDSSVAWVTGTEIFLEASTSTVTVAAGAGVTIVTSTGLPLTVSQWSVVRLKKRASNQWIMLTANTVNPMTTTGDVIYGGSSGVPARLAAGTNGQVLTLASGVPSWATPSSGMTNPMTTTGDMIYETGGVPTRLPIGTAGQVLHVIGGHPAWFTASFMNDPTTTTGDMIFNSGGVSTRLPIGTSAQVLTVSGGVPVWAAAGGGGSQAGIASACASGDDFPFYNGVGGFVSNTLNSSTRCHFHLVQLDSALTFTAMAIAVRSTYAASSMDIGIYEFKGAGKPGACLASANFATTATGRIAVTLGSPVTLAAGLYFVCWHGNNTSPSIVTQSAAAAASIGQFAGLSISDAMTQMGAGTTTLMEVLFNDSGLPGGSYSLGMNMTGLTMSSSNIVGYDTSIPCVALVKQ